MSTLLDSVLDAGIGDALATTVAHLRERTVSIRSGRTGSGAGVIWSADGLIVTNAHVVNAARAHVRFHDGERAAGDVVSADPWRDLAAIRIPPRSLTPAPHRDTDTLRPGELVLALGHPLGWENAVSVGVLHAVERIGGSGPPRWIRADITLMPGNSGGPLADADGRVIALNTLVANGLAFAVPVDAVDAFLNTERPMIGVALQPAIVEQRRYRAFGMAVVDVAAGSAAATAGIRPGDVLRTVDGLPLAAPSDIAQLLHAAKGGRIDVGLVRDGRFIDVGVELTTGPRGARAA